MQFKFVTIGKKLRLKLATLSLSQQETYNILSLFIGVFAALLATILHEMTLLLTKFFQTNQSFTLRSWLLGGGAILISGFLSTRFFKNTQGSGVPMVKLWLIARNGVFPKNVSSTKFIATILSLSSGITLGREGPTVTITTAFASSLGQYFSLSKKYLKPLVAQASTAAIAAAFNTPLAAVIFTLEEIVGDLNTKALGPIVITSVIASLTSYYLHGNQALFSFVEITGLSYDLLPFALGLGIICALLGTLWVKHTLFLRSFTMKYLKGHELTIIMISFMLIGLSSYLFIEILGAGDDGLKQLMNREILELNILIPLLILKFTLTALCFSSRISGGIFMPSLFIGGLIGATYAQSFHSFSDYQIELTTFVLLGMGAFFASVIKAPFTSILIIFELTQNYELILPLMLTNMTSYLLASKFKNSKQSIYEAISEQNGHRLPTREDDQLLDQLHVEDTYQRGATFLESHLTVVEAYEKSKHYLFSGYPILEKQKLIGVVAKTELYRLHAQGSTLKLSELTFQEPVTIFPDQSLLVAFHKLKRYQIGRLCVVSRLDPKYLLGVITAEDIVSYFGFHLNEEAEEDKTTTATS